jgi:hypothetical protein
MATLVLSLAGAAIGAKVGGAVLGLSGMVIGRAIGATLGRVIDQRLMGRGSNAVETARIDRLRVTGAGVGAPLPRLWGRMRVAGHVIWAADFREIAPSPQSSRSKSKSPPRPAEAARYTVSLAIALCEGEIAGVGRIWAEGVEIGREALNLRLHRGSAWQQPDPAIAAVEGLANAPAYRGTAYVVLEDLDLAPWGNRIPNLSFEVIRSAAAPGTLTLQDAIRAVAWMPGSGEYSLATGSVSIRTQGPLLGAFSQEAEAANRNAPGAETDFVNALRSLQSELPGVRSGLLIVSWFGSDLRAAECRIEPKVEYADRDALEQPWSVAGRLRADTPEVARLDGAPVYGGTPSDASVLQAIAALKAAGQAVVYYPFILMEQMAGNALPNPYADAPGQPPLPWRGRITLSVAPGRLGSPDGTSAAAAQVAAFFGTVGPGHFQISPGSVSYSGPDEWSYRRYILHNAALCAAAGGVEAFCIGSEMVGLTTIRGPGNSFPAVARMVELLQDVRAILGPGVKLTYAADWSEYWGWQDGQGARIFHLDPLWAHPDCDVIAIDNYMPLSDWRDGEAHLDAAQAASIHDLDYLRSNVAGGEGYDWFYATDTDRRLQIRSPITDGSGGEPWVFRYKDIRSWWENLHYDRPDGVRAAEPTAWAPRSKPVWFTEYGCAAIDKGTNQPNKFLDPKSSESVLPWFSDGRRDDLMQMQYLRAMAAYWLDPANNPVSEVYGGPMVDWDRAHVWAWDARPWPRFPANSTLWTDAPNWTQGHWITGRATNQPLASVLAEICLGAGLAPGDFDVTGVEGLVRGYAVPSTATARAALQPLMIAHGIEAVEREGRLVFRMRAARSVAMLDPDALVARDGGAVELVRAARAETVGRVRLTHIDPEGSFETRAAEAVIPDETGIEVAETELALTLLPAEAREAVRRWLAEARIARDQARFALPPSSTLGAGDVVALPTPDGARLWRIDRVDLAAAREVEAVRIERAPAGRGLVADDIPAPAIHAAPASVASVFLELPLIRGDEAPHAPWLAAMAERWRGPVAAWQAPVAGGGFVLSAWVPAPAALGVIQSPLPARRPGLWQESDALTLRLPRRVELVSRSRQDVLEGANLMALGTGEGVELIQFAGAELIGPGLWHLTDLLRGQFGTEAVRPTVWPAGTMAVMIDPALRQIDLPPALRALARRWRVGPAELAVDDPGLAEGIAAFRGVGLRPYAPAHLRAERVGSGNSLSLAWMRRTRIGGDDWEALDVPLAEEGERYLVRVVIGDVTLREVQVGVPAWIYTAAQQEADGLVAGTAFVVQVSQVSAVWGPGPAARRDLVA